MNNSPIRIAVTGGAGQICYNLLYRIAAGDCFGPDQPVILHILELPVAMTALEGVAMELDDCAFPLLAGINLSDDVNAAMAGVNWALLVGAKPRGKGQERGDLIRDNGPIFTDTGSALNGAASDVHVLTVGNPCNTNCLIAMTHASAVPNNRFHAMMRLDQNRATSQLAAKAGVPVRDVSNVAVWGNHSASQVPDYHNARIGGRPAEEVINDSDWLQNEFIDTVAKRGAAIIEARGKSSAASAASAAIDAVRSIITPTDDGQFYSSAVISDDNPYGIPDGVVFSFPCRTGADGTWAIVPDLEWDDFIASRIQTTIEELIGERDLVKDLL